MKSKLFLFVYLFLVTVFFSCKENVNRFNDKSLEDYKSMVTVYGDFHFRPESTDEQILLTVIVQNWLFENIKESVIVAEGDKFTGSPKSFDSLTAGMDSVEISNFLLCDVTFRFSAIGRDVYYGDDMQYNNIQEGIIKTSKDYGNQYINDAVLLYKMQPYIDLRSKYVAESALWVAKNTGKKVAIIIGNLHLEWFQENGFKVIHPPYVF